jgi:hypothetical protein
VNDVHRTRVRLRTVRAPPPFALRQQPEAGMLQAAAFARLVIEVRRPHVRLRTARAPPLLPLRRQTEAWRLR